MAEKCFAIVDMFDFPDGRGIEELRRDYRSACIISDTRRVETERLRKYISELEMEKHYLRVDMVKMVDDKVRQMQEKGESETK